MKKKLLAVLMVCVMSTAVFAACGKKEEAAAPAATEEAAPAATEEAATEEAAVEEAPVEEAATEEAVTGEMVSDETFAALQDNYATLVEANNAVVDLYNSDDIEANADVEALLNQASDVITQMGEIKQDTLTEADAETLNQAMLDLLDGLSATVDAM